MKKQKILILAVVAILVIAVVGYSTKAKSPKAATTNNPSINNTPSTISQLERANNEGEVSVGATYLNPLGQEKKGYVTFLITLNTHTLDLNSNPLQKNVKLTDGKGNILSYLAQWEPLSGDSHHLVGKLHFQNTGFNLQEQEGIRLVIQNYGGMEKRELVWENST